MRCLSTPLLVATASALLLVIVSCKKERPLVRQNSKFALSLYKYMSEGHKNFVFSPFSISSCMGMVYGAATGSSARELAAVMKFKRLERSLHRRFRRLFRQFAGGNYTMALANRIFVNRPVPVLPKFKRLARFYYGASVKRLDFTRRPLQSVQYINNWVERRTHKKITGLLSTADIKSNTNFVIVNALFFRGFWRFPFRKATKATFHLSNSRTVSVDMMSTPRNRFLRTESKKMRCTILEIPYVGGEVKMYILLPNSANDLPWLENSLNYDTLQKAVGSMKAWTGSLRLPKFRVTSSYDLASVLRTIGLKTSLQHGKVTLISSSPSSGGLADVNHKACIDVSEERTDASAATAAVSYRSGFFSFGPTVVVDRPFLFIIKHHTGSILFVGRVLDPTARF